MPELNDQTNRARVFMIATAIVGLSACTGTAPNINQTTACSVTGYHSKDNINICTEGQKVSYMPERWGNEQLPILFAALNCDHRFQIIHNKSGVSCIFKPVTAVEDTSDKKPME